MLPLVEDDGWFMDTELLLTGRAAWAIEFSIAQSAGLMTLTAGSAYGKRPCWTLRGCSACGASSRDTRRSIGRSNWQQK